MGKFAYIGHETVGKLLEERLAPAGWVLSDDVEDCDVSFTYCTSQSKLEDAYFEDDGLIKRMKKGSLLIDLSASTPDFARELGAIAEVSDLHPVEAPLVVVDMTMPDAFGDKDNLACFVSGADDDVEAALNLLDLVVGTAQTMGAQGTAQMARAAYTAQVTAQIVGALEADALYKATQNAATSVDHLEGHAGAVGAHAAQILEAADEERFSGTFTVEMLMGEVVAAMQAADDVDLILPQLESSMHIIELLAVIGGADLNPAALSLVFADEQTCADHGLDWSRAEQFYGTEHDNDDEDDIDEDDGHGAFGGFDGFSGYSTN